ncbi:MAG TPA: Mu-like prophage major head subunit gpT family protein, partial [Anaerolineae bacterium]|nr:Mu-like prophage major head subunit gpT family protein [Anaerolineae bacterium]
MAISEQWAELLLPGLRRIFEVQRDALAAVSLVPGLFNIIPSTKAQEFDLGIGGFGDWKAYKGVIEYDDMEQLWKTTYTHEEYARGFKVERKLVDDDQYNIINRRPRGLALSAMRTREKHAASVFNNAHTSTYAGGDAIELCGAHPYSPSNSSTQSNDGTSALSYDAVVETRRLMREFKDDRAQLVQVNPTLILHPPELEETASAIVNTMNRVDVADYHDSFIRRKGITNVGWDYLTDANNWFLIDPQLAKLFLLWIDRIPL